MLRLLILFHFFKFSVSSFDFSNLCFSTAVLQKLLPTQAKVSPSIWQSSRKGKLNSVCAVLTAPITPLRSQHTQLLRHNQPSRYSTSRTFPTKDAPLLMKHLLMIVPCTPDSHATVPSALSQNLDKEIWSGICTNSAWSQPAFKHCQQHHLLFCVWVFL